MQVYANKATNLEIIRMWSEKSQQLHDYWPFLYLNKRLKYMTRWTLQVGASIEYETITHKSMTEDTIISCRYWFIINNEDLRVTMMPTNEWNRISSLSIPLPPTAFFSFGNIYTTKRIPSQVPKEQPVYTFIYRLQLQHYKSSKPLTRHLCPPLSNVKRHPRLDRL